MYHTSYSGFTESVEYWYPSLNLKLKCDPAQKHQIPTWTTPIAIFQDNQEMVLRISIPSSCPNKIHLLEGHTKISASPLMFIFEPKLNWHVWQTFIAYSQSQYFDIVMQCCVLIHTEYLIILNVDWHIFCYPPIFYNKYLPYRPNRLVKFNMFSKNGEDKQSKTPWTLTINMFNIFFFS